MSDSPNPPSSGKNPASSDGSRRHASGGHPARRRSRRKVTRRAAVPSIAAREAHTPTAAEQLAAQKARPRGVEQVLAADYPSPQDAPYAAVTIATNGIHPSTARLVGLAVVLFDDSWRVRHEVVFHVNVGEEPGAWHLHGYSPEDLAEAVTFERRTDQVLSLLDGRTVLAHQAAFTWGFIAYEFKRARRSAVRRMRSRNGRRGARGRAHSTVDQRVPDFAPPVPTRIVDTLGTARRQARFPLDTRLRGVAASYGLTASAPPEAMPHLGSVASDERAAVQPDSLLLADAHLVAALHRAQVASASALAELDPADLVADKFGLQRSTIRVEAAEAARVFVNPGMWEQGQPLVQGMEFVLSPDVTAEPDELIARGTRAGLVYSEKLNRRSSLVVCNRADDLRGKAMHADRKGIPLVTDDFFLELLEDVASGEREPRPVKPGAGTRPQTSRLKVPGSGEASRSGSSGRRGSGRSARSGRGRGKQGGQGQSKSGKNRSGQGRKNQRNRSGHNRAGQSQSQGQGQGQNKSGQDRSSQNRSGQGRKNQRNRSGRNRTNRNS